MNAWSLMLPLPLAALFLAAPQAPQDPDPKNLEATTAVVSLSELQFTTQQGATQSVSARNVVEIRLLEDQSRIRLELVYENGDYSMIDAQSFHLLRNAGGAREVRLVRSRTAGMRFPKLP